MIETPPQTKLCDRAIKVINSEIESISALLPRIGDKFVKATELLLACQGRVIVMGIGKSGHIGNKIAATFASTGTPAYFVHPSEASHGDLGMIMRNDVVLMISYSGETEELLHLIPHIQQQGIPIISMTGNLQSTLAQQSHTHLDISVTKEAGLLGLAPTSSTTVTLVMGDALAITLLEARGFTSEDFAFYHPGGSLGRKLLLTTNDLMHKGDDVPKVHQHATISHALVEVTSKRLGMTVVIDGNDKLLGIFTDGDLRRSLDSNYDISSTQIQTVMTKHCRTITPDFLAADALTLMRQNKITSLVVLNNQDDVVGVLHMHDILRAGITL
ncbi:MAG: arabinose-5-phosphate isomerase [Coxiella sp. (in: Bacteria)]|nr:MAG: arabinose-5-phosphate isomerase [Coxiella sp. (in: g-proteobacteria)]